MVKKLARDTFKRERSSLTPEQRAVYSFEICEMITGMPEFLDASLVLIYHPYGTEVDVKNIARRAFSLGKKVGLPCMYGNDMRFLCVNSIDNLPEMTYDIPEEFREECENITDFSDSVCIVPALALDEGGMRMGYGKGCYDRFLRGYEGVSVCAVFPSLFVSELPTDEYDVAVDIGVIPTIGIKRFG